MTQITIPPAALEAGAKARYEEMIRQLAERSGESISLWSTWRDLPDDVRAEEIQQEQAAFEAMVAAWPMMHVQEWQRPWLGGMSGTDIILPLPQEGGDE